MNTEHLIGTMLVSSCVFGIVGAVFGAIENKAGKLFLFGWVVGSIFGFGIYLINI